MSNLFIKFLPVEGEVKDGDYLCDKGDRSEYVKVVRVDGSKAFIVHPQFKHLPAEDLWVDTAYMERNLPHLCSRDIQVGDKFLDKETLEEHTCIKKDDNKIWWEEDCYMANFLCFKVLGLISPDATWVTDGMEVKEEDVNICVDSEFEGEEDNVFNLSQYTFVPLPPKSRRIARLDNKTSSEKLYISFGLSIKLRCPSSHKHFH